MSTLPRLSGVITWSLLLFQVQNRATFFRHAFRRILRPRGPNRRPPVLPQYPHGNLSWVIGMSDTSKDYSFAMILFDGGIAPEVYFRGIQYYPERTAGDVAHVKEPSPAEVRICPDH